MAITVNIYYTGVYWCQCGTVGEIRAEEGNLRYEYFFQWKIRKQYF